MIICDEYLTLSFFHDNTASTPHFQTKKDYLAQENINLKYILKTELLNCGPVAQPGRAAGS